MPILNIQASQAGLSGSLPSLAYIQTSDTAAQVLATGYLNKAVQSGLASFSLPCLANVSTIASASAAPIAGWYNVSFSAGNWSLTDTSDPGHVVLPTKINHLATYTDVNGTLSEDATTAINGGNIQAGLSGTAGYLASFPATASKGSLRVTAVANTGDTLTTISNAAMGQASVISIPDPGTATSKFLLQDGTNTAVTVTTANITNLKYGATPVAQVDPQSCTIAAVAGATNTATVTVQLKDGSGTNLTQITPFRVYASSASNGLTLASAASTGFSVASGGLSVNNGAAVTTQINAVSSATGGCVLSLLDTGKQTSYLVLVLGNGVKISAQLTTGSYG